MPAADGTPPAGDGTPPARDSGRAGLRRSARLFAAFRAEQSDPHRFYTLLAADSVAQVRRWAPLQDATVLDVGAGPGFFAGAFADEGARYVGLEADAGEATSLSVPDPPSTLGRVLGDGERLPFRDGAVDVCFSSNVMEHVPRPWRVAEEMLRVTRPGGLVWIAYPAWLSPWGGHETSPWHYLGGAHAADRYARRTGSRPKNDYGRTMFAVSVAEGMRWARSRTDAELLDARPRYLPDALRGVLAVPGLREILTWNVALTLRRR